MSKKQKPITTTQQNTVDPMVSRMQQYTMDQTKDILAPYLNSGTSGYGVAGFNQDQTSAFEGLRGQVGGMTPQDVQGWMNPYISNVVDTSTGRIQRQGDEALNAIRGRQAAGSAFGGTGARAALQSAKTQEGTQRQIAETTAQLMAQGYDRATATALSNEALQTNALQGVLGIGNQQQELAQRKLDVPLNALGMLQKSTPQQYSSTTTSTAPNTAPSPFQQVLGLAGTIGGGFLGGPAGSTMLTNWLTGRRPAEMVY
jgi:hypothetical protein